MRENKDRPAKRRRNKPSAAQRRGKRRKGLIPTIKYLTARLGNKLIRSPLVPIIGGLLLLIMILAGLTWMFTNKNAYDVYVGEELVVSIARSKDITEKWIYDNALAKLSSDLGAKVQVEPDVSIVPIHKPSKNLSTVDYAIGAVYKAFSETGYKLEASEIYVNDVPIVILRNEAEVKTVYETVMLSYVSADAKIIEKDWVEDKVESIPKFVDVSEIQSVELAVSKLSAKIETENMYQVRGGDSVWQLCQQFGINQDRMAELNPNMPEIMNGNIKAGQLIKVVAQKPLCSVRTVEEITYTDAEKRTVEERPNDAQPKGYTKLIQQGKDGQREVTAHLVRINGNEVGREEVGSVILVNPVLEIVEVGTR